VLWLSLQDSLGCEEEVCVCVWRLQMDGRTDGRCGPRKGGAAVGKRICGLGISIFLLLLFLRTGDSKGEEQQRATTDSGLVAPARP